MPEPVDMAAFWDERAREDALYFVDNRLEYRNADERWFWEQGERDLDRMLAALGAPAIEPHARVLDLGCGVGRLTRVLSNRAGAVEAVDVSAEMLERAKANLRDRDNVTFHLGDGTSLRPLPDEAVDAAISLVVFQHIPDPEVTLGYLREFGRVLKPAGWAAFQVSTDPVIHTKDYPTPSRLQRLLRRAPRGQDHPAWRGSAVSTAALRETLGGAGLTVEAITGEDTQYTLVLARKP